MESYRRAKLAKQDAMQESWVLVVFSSKRNIIALT